MAVPKHSSMAYKALPFDLPTQNTISVSMCLYGPQIHISIIPLGRGQVTVS